ncbi:hypothetical protein GQ473_03955 [archaeon]|nr:hypothetical protein [archaeon]
MISTKIEFDFDKKKSDIIFKSIKPDLTNTKRAITKVVIDKNGTLSVSIEANDTTALRAATNTLLRLIDTSEKVLNI